MATSTVSSYRCASTKRRELVRTRRDDAGNPVLNGIDFLEVTPGAQTTLTLTLIHNLPGAAADTVPGAADLLAANLLIQGGVRIRTVNVLSAVRATDNTLTITVDTAGDFSLYTLRLVTSKDDPTPPAKFDPLLCQVRFSFKTECRSDFDCAPTDDCPPQRPPAPPINYLAKDYASFRQLMLDRMSLIMPGWSERNPADVGVMLVEALAYVGDELSYKQDAIATEAYLGTARLRTSVRRHARLVDYFMHDGCNARAWVRFQLDKGAAPVAIPRYTKLLTRLVPAQPPQLLPDPAVYDAALIAGAQVFETIYADTLYEGHNEIQLYTWGETECCLPKGATQATLKGPLPNLKAGSVLILAEVLGPESGDPADADPAHRHAVRLTSATAAKDPLLGDDIVEVSWAPEDALPFPLCISAHLDDEHGNKYTDDISKAWGNIVLADHGRTLSPPIDPTKNAVEDLGTVPQPALRRTPAVRPSADPMSAPGGPGRSDVVPPRYRPMLHESPLTQTDPAPFGPDADGPGSASAAILGRNLRTAVPVITLTGETPGKALEAWSAARDLLGSRPTDKSLVVEIESDATAWLRFGDGVHGQRPPPGTRFTASYRVGNGAAGNIPADAIAHVMLPGVLSIAGVGNPLPAAGGIDPETIEHVRQSAPFAFRTQERAVTPADYADVAGRMAGVSRAAAHVVWTGSWNTVFVSADRECGCDIDAPFRGRLRDFLEPFRMAGQDLDIDAPRLVPLEIGLHVCVDPAYFASDVAMALAAVFSSGTLPDGTRGLFHPDNFTFGQPVYLSRLYAAAQAVEGVADARIEYARRLGRLETDGVAAGMLKMDRLEVAQLSNDLNFPDRGVFKLDVEGGK